MFRPGTSDPSSIEPYFEGSYWTGTAPPISTTVFPTNAVVDMRTGVLLAGTGDIGEAVDFLGYVEQAAGDPRVRLPCTPAVSGSLP